MRALLVSKRLINLTVTTPSSSSSPSSSLSLFYRTLTTYRSSLSGLRNTFLHQNLLKTPWNAIQHRGAKILGIDVRVGHVVERKGRIYEVVQVQHTKQGRGGATIQVELRDLNSGNKTNERFRCEEALERISVEKKPMTYLYSDGNHVVLMEPGTFEQIEVSKNLFGEAAVYLKEDLEVILQLYDGRPMLATVPTRVTCKVLEVQDHMKGTKDASHHKKVLLENGHYIMAPVFINPGDLIVINTAEHSYLERSKE